ncbi:hypothetical protein ACETAC_03940 [Aceticella autotrophica]|uniref:Uncharacterized protein n=1 Tax=Aceticella autotrophica TaxID=2755338 RepID=A0A975AXM4_9THEO|nr:hypothetical protein ACETAC_03940 [Aceticella autotrophica]
MMPIILLLIILFILFPYLIMPFFIFFVIGMIFLLPYLLIFNSFYNIITIPWQIIKIATDKRVRKNHSLEHATINVLEERFGRNLRIGGLSYSNGFTLSGPDLPNPQVIVDAAHEGLNRMKQGEKNLAIHKRCGTSIAAANFLFSLAFILILLFYQHFNILNIIAVFLLAAVIAKPFGLILQKFFTTHPDVKEMEILDISTKPSQHESPFEIMINPSRTYFIRTSYANSGYRIF